MSASVKIMLSYDYCHFEVSKGTDADLSNEQIDAMRKDVQRLALKAVEQFKHYKDVEEKRYARQGEYERAQRDAEQIEKLAEEDRTPRQQAVLKAFKDRNWKEYVSQKYDFEDDEREWMGMGQDIPDEDEDGRDRRNDTHEEDEE